MIKNVTIKDISDYDYRYSHNGGAYAWYYIYERINADTFALYYDTSAEFSFCEVRGIFQACHECDEFQDGKCTLPPQTLTKNEVFKEIIESKKKPNQYEVRIDWER